MIGLTGAVALLALAGCGAEDDRGPLTLNWYVAPQPGGSFEAAAERCTEASDGAYEVRVQLLPTDADSQREQLVRRLAAEDRSIDIIGMDVIWTGEFANAGWIREWTGERARRASEGVFPSVLETARFEDRLWAAPFTTNTQMLWYRADRVAEPPRTWDEMIEVAERLPPGENTIQIQADQYEGLTVSVVALINSAGAQLLTEDQEQVALARGPTERALGVIGRLANSPVADPAISTSDEDSSRLSFEEGDSTFMINYPFVLSSAEENAPEIAETMRAARYPRVVPDRESAPPLGGFNIGVSANSQHPEEAFDAAECLVRPENQVKAAQDDGLPPTQIGLYGSEEIRSEYDGFVDVLRESIESAVPRPTAVAYQDLSLAIQRTIHPPSDIDPQNPTPTYEDLRRRLEQAVRVEGIL